MGVAHGVQDGFPWDPRVIPWGPLGLGDPLALGVCVGVCVCVCAGGVCVLVCAGVRVLTF